MIPKKSYKKGAGAMYMANEHPIKMAKGGDIEKPTAKPLPKGFDPNNLNHYLEPGEQPMDADTLAKLGYTIDNKGGENSYITPSGDYMHYKPITAESKDYNVPNNPFYKAPTTVTIKNSSAFKPKYLYVSEKGTAEWNANQKLIEEERNKRASGPVGFKCGGGIKGYLAGGDIRKDQGVQGKKQRGYKTDFGSYAKDTGLAIADWGMQGFGGQDIIKDKDYSTRAGSQSNRANTGVGAVASAVGSTVLAYYSPEASKALTAGKRKVGSTVGKDEGISDADYKTISKVNQVGDIASSISGIAGGGGMGGSLIGMMGGKKKSGEAPSTEIAPTDISTEQQVDADINNGVFEGNNQQQSQKLGFYDGKDLDATLTPEQKLLWINADDNQKQDYMMNGFAKGGEIKGPGTGTSDSIPAKLEDGGFIVPAKNANKAKAIREEYLGTDGNTTAPLKKGDTAVKVSDGEHYFTQEEKEYLISQGVDLDSLAPDAKNSAAMADGGPVRKNSTGNPTADKLIDELYSDKKKTQKEIKDLYQKINEFTDSGSVDFNDISEVKSAKSYAESLIREQFRASDKNKFIKDWNKVQSVEKQKLIKSGANKEEIKKFEERTNAENAFKNNFGLYGTKNPSSIASEELSSIEKRVKKDKFSDYSNKLAADIVDKSKQWEDAQKNPQKYSAEQITKINNDRDNLYSLNETKKKAESEGKYWLFNQDYEKYNPEVVKQKASAQENKIASTPSVAESSSDIKNSDSVKFWDKTVNDKTIEGNKNTGNSVTSPSKGGARKVGSGVVPTAYTPPINPSTGKPMTMEEQKTFNLLNPMQALPMKTGESNSAASEEMTLKTVPESLNTPGSGIVQPKKKQGFDASQAFSLFQVGEGLNQLNKDGKRPVDGLPADYLATIEEAKAQALYGIDPTERSIAERGIERNRRSDIANIVNLSGGSAGTALGNIRAASMGADEQLTNLSAQSEKIRLNKQKYYADLVADKANRSRTLFEDKLNAFNTNQQAGAALLGAGIRNMIGADRYKKEIAAEEEAARLSNVTG